MNIHYRVYRHGLVKGNSMNIEIRFPYLKELLKWRGKHFKGFLNLAYFSTLRKASVVMELNCGTHYLNAIDAYNLSLCNCRGSYVEVEGQKSRVENSKFLSILKVLQPFWKLPNVAKQLVLLSKLKNFAYDYNLCILKVSLVELKFDARFDVWKYTYFIIHWNLKYTNMGDD
jgi:hypothetical protein